MSDETIERIKAGLKKIAQNEWTCYSHTGDNHTDCAVAIARELLQEIEQIHCHHCGLTRDLTYRHAKYAPFGYTNENMAGITDPICCEVAL